LSRSALAAFHALHASGCFVLPNPWDVGSAVYLEHLGRAARAAIDARGSETGSFDGLAGAASFSELNGLFQTRV